MVKKALVVGINYVGTGNDLQGCVNDAYNMETMLKRKGFTVEMLLERDATTANIKAALERLVAGLRAGDVIVFHYSGHGSQLPSRVEPDGYEEIICPIDLDWKTRVITDDDLRTVFNKVPAGVNTTVILDCCHSGSGLDQTESLDLGVAFRSALVAPEEGRFLPPPTDVQARLATRNLVNWTASRDVNASALLIAGCRSDQTSADAFIEGTYQGAATYSLLQALKADPSISYRKLVTQMNQFMVDNGYDQRPQLDGSSKLYDNVFLVPTGELVVDPVAPAPVPPAPQPEPAPVPLPTQAPSFTFPGWVWPIVVFAALAALWFGLLS